MKEHWNLYYRKEYCARPWPWRDISWEAIDDKEIEDLPSAIEDFFRYCPDDGTSAMSGVPADLPREWPECRTRLAVYHDPDSIYVFLVALRPEQTIPELSEDRREDFGCYFAMDGSNRGLYLGLNQDGESICLAKVWDVETSLPADFDEFPWTQFRDDPWMPLPVDYETRIIELPEGSAACWRIGRNVLRKDCKDNCIEFTAGRRCFSTGELVSWGSNLMWETRHDEMGILRFADEVEPSPVPWVERIDVAYDPEQESGEFICRWRDIWSEERVASVPNESHYSDYIHRYTIAVNGQEQTEDIQAEMRNAFSIPDGWNRLEILNAVGRPARVVNFQKFSGNRIVPGAHSSPPGLPFLEELRELFETWAQNDELQYIAPGTWGQQPGGSDGDPPIYCLDHQGAFRMEPYALACLHLVRQDAFAHKVRAACDRILEYEQEGHWYPCLCVDPEAKTPFAGGAFGHGSVGEALVLGHRVLNDRNYLDAATRAVEGYQLYPLEHNQNYAAFALWHLAELYSETSDEAAIELALYYLRFAGNHIDLAGAQRGHNYYSAYGGITLKGLAKLLRILPHDHSKYPLLRNKVIRSANQMLARQQASGLFAERNRKYLGYHSLCPAAGLFETALALGDEASGRIEPSLVAAYTGMKESGNLDGLLIVRKAEYVKGQPEGSR